MAKLRATALFVYMWVYNIHIIQCTLFILQLIYGVLNFTKRHFYFPPIEIFPVHIRLKNGNACYSLFQNLHFSYLEI